MTAPAFSSSDAFFGGPASPPQIPFASRAPSQSRQQAFAMPGAPKLPGNPYADAAWRMQRARGAMRPNFVQRLPKAIL
jgi:hypothetical protein